MKKISSHVRYPQRCITDTQADWYRDASSNVKFRCNIISLKRKSKSTSLSPKSIESFCEISANRIDGSLIARSLVNVVTGTLVNIPMQLFIHCCFSTISLTPYRSRGGRQPLGAACPPSSSSSSGASMLFCPPTSREPVPLLSSDSYSTTYKYN